MDKGQYKAYRELSRAGWNVQQHNQVRLNGGSESLTHVLAKTIVAHVGHENGYRVASEVEHDERGQIDVLLWGNPERLTLAVECEHNVSDDVVEDKVDRYVRGTPVDDLAVVNCDILPPAREQAATEVREVLGL